MQDCINSSALAMELLQSCTKPSTWYNMLKAYISIIYCNLKTPWINMEFYMYIQIYRTNGLLWQSIYALMRVIFWYSFSKLRGKEGNKKQNYTHYHGSIYIVCSLTQHFKPMNDIQRDDLDTSDICMSLALLTLWGLIQCTPVANLIVEIRRFYDCLISTIGFRYC